LPQPSRHTTIFAAFRAGRNSRRAAAGRSPLAGGLPRRSAEAERGERPRTDRTPWQLQALEIVTRNRAFGCPCRFNARPTEGHRRAGIGNLIERGRFGDPDIAEAVNACRARHDHVLTTGGIGPTHDDVTAASVAKALDRPLVRHPEAERRLLAHYPPGKVNEARMKMADAPEGAELIDNPVSVAPGFTVENVHVLPGVPSILRAMFQGLAPRLRGGAVVHSRTVTVFAPEGELAKPLAALQARHPTVEIGSYPFVRQDRFGASVVLRSVDEAAIAAAAEELLAEARERGVEVLELY
jgi:molybdopterin-biosynthesis enzyme MoeA-like protein